MEKKKLYSIKYSYHISETSLQNNKTYAEILTWVDNYIPTYIIKVNISMKKPYYLLKISTKNAKMGANYFT